MSNIFFDLSKKYNTDKSFYADFYDSIFGDKRESVKKVLELGIGTQSTMRATKDYKIGSSLRLWREYFPNAQIYGADILSETMFEEPRIETFLCNETKKEDLAELIKNTGTDIDVFIDDGSHQPKDQLNTFRYLMPLFKKDVFYIIEDIRNNLNFFKHYLKRYNYLNTGKAILLVKNKL